MVAGEPSLSAVLDRRAARAGLILALSGLGLLLVERGLGLPPIALVEAWAPVAYRVTLAVYVIAVALSLPLRRPVRQRLPGLALEGVLLAVVMTLAAGGLLRPAFGLAACRLLGRAGADLARIGALRPLVESLEARPLRLVSVSFLAAILVGTGLLSLPAAGAGRVPIQPVDALFTATSAVCVTGLVVRSTPHDWSPFGQAVILALIQIGGLGIMALSLSVVFILGGRMKVRHRAALFQAMDAETVAGLRSGMRALLLVTLAFEAVGFALLAGRFALDGRDGAQAAWLGLFHSVSAFNNAGFALWDDSLTAYRSDLVVNSVVAGLVVAGGLGFAVLADLLARLRPRRRKAGPARRLGIHSRLVLLVSVLLLAAGALAVFFVEFDAGLAGLGLMEKLMAALFQSVSARTAGFNTVDIAAFSSSGLFLVSVLMFIGASPGSTGGGIKTSTLAVVALAVRSMLRGREEVEVLGRRLGQAVVIRSVAIVVMSGAIVTLFLGALLFLEPDLPFGGVLFETVSAFATVGLSTGITPELGTPARLLVTLLMFIGRIGPLTMALAIGERAVVASVRYPEGRVMVG